MITWGNSHNLKLFVNTTQTHFSTVPSIKELSNLLLSNCLVLFFSCSQKQTTENLFDRHFLTQLFFALETSFKSDHSTVIKKKPIIYLYNYIVITPSVQRNRKLFLFNYSCERNCGLTGSLGISSAVGFSGVSESSVLFNLVRSIWLCRSFLTFL